MARQNLQLITEIRDVLAQAPPSTHWGVAVLNAKTFDVVAGVRPDMPAQALSLSKLATAVLCNRMITQGTLAIDMPITIERSDARPGGYLRRYVGWEMPLQALARGMLHVSDTTAQRGLTRFMGGAAACNHILARPLTSPDGVRVALKTTRLEPIDGDTTATAPFYTGTTTPIEAAALLGLAMQTSSLTKDALQRTIFGFGLTRDLPGNALPDVKFLKELAKAERNKPNKPRLAILQNPPQRSEFPTMMGIDGDERHSVAQIGDLIVAALAKGYHPDLPETAEHPAHDIQARIGQVVFAHA